MKRECEVCHHKWKTKEGPIWIVLCPKCRVSGYHAERRAASAERTEP